MVIPPVIIDIEASGFGAGGYPIEIGYVDNRGKTWCSLVTPCDGWNHWNAVAERLHHISRGTLLNHGKSVEVIAQHLNEALMEKTVYSDGWLHDFTWLHILFEAADIRPHFKLQDLRTILSPYQQSIWHQTKHAVLNELGIDRHRASADAKVLQMTWLKTLQAEKAALV